MSSILIVEDDLQHRRRLVEILESSGDGYSILLAVDGRSALEIAQAEMPGLIILDWEIPAPNGLEVLRVLRETEGTRRIPVIMFTHRSSVKDLQLAFEAGATDYLRKPPSKIELLARVRATIVMGKKRILFLASTPRDLSYLRLGEEVRDISHGLRASKLRSRFTLLQEWAVRPDSLQQALLEDKPHIVHFSGHGGLPVGGEAEVGAAVAEGALGTGIALEAVDGRAMIVSPKAIGDLFRIVAGTVECVVLNACFSRPQAEVIRQHVPYVIGMSREIRDASAIAFSVGFYKALGAGCEYRKAFELGRNASELVDSDQGDIAVLLEREDASSE